MITNALGLIEVNGFPAALDAADTCLKASNISLIGYEKVQAGLVVVKISGDVGAVKAAIDAARISVARLGEVVAATVIARPAEGTGGMVYSPETVSPVSEYRGSDSALQDPDALLSHPEENQLQDSGLATAEEAEPVMAQQGQDLTSTEGERVETPPGALEAAVPALEELPKSGEFVTAEAEPEMLASEPEAPATEPETLASETGAAAESAARDHVMLAQPQPAGNVDVQQRIVTCNLCGNPLCTRKKGQPASMCLHYKQHSPKKNKDGQH